MTRHFSAKCYDPSRCLIRSSSFASCSAMRSDIRSSSEAPEYEVACSTSPRRLSRRMSMRLSSSVVSNTPVGTAALVLRGATAFLATTCLLRVAAAFLPAVGRLRVFAAFLATVRDFRVFAAFLTADFLEADFDFAMFPTPPQSARSGFHMPLHELHHPSKHVAALRQVR